MTYDITNTNVIYLGRQGENLARTVEIDVSSILRKWPNATISLLVQRNQEDTFYLAPVVIENEILKWTVSNADTEFAGDGKAEIRATQDDVIVKSAMMNTHVSDSLGGTETDIPDPAQTWADTIIAASEQAKQSAEDALASELAAKEAAESITGLESNIKTAEAARVEAENERISAENERESAETSRETAENNRVAAETERVAAENERVDAEIARSNAETSRAFAEHERQTAEMTRVSAETSRETAENNRVSAETERAATFIGYQNEINQFKTEIVTDKDAATENTRFAIGTAEQTLEVPSMEEFNELRDDLNNTIETTYSTNLFDVKVSTTFENQTLDTNTGKSVYKEGWLVTDYIKVISGREYSNLYYNNGAAYRLFTATVIGYSDKNENSFVSDLGTISSATSAITIPNDVSYIRYSNAIDNTYHTMFCENDGVSFPVYETPGIKDQFLKYGGYVKKIDLVQPNITLELLDTSLLKGRVDNFHRDDPIETGFDVVGNTDRAQIVDGVATTAQGSGYLILYKHYKADEVVSVTGSSLCICFNIRDRNNFVFIRQYDNGFQLYERIGGKSQFIGNIVLSNIGAIMLYIRGKVVQIYNDYVYNTSFDLPHESDGTVGIAFGIIGNESYKTVGSMSYRGLERYNAFKPFWREINNGSNLSKSVQNGVLKLVVDRQNGYSDRQYYRSMVGYRADSYDYCMCHFKSDILIDASLTGADEYLILQWHDNGLDIGMSPFLSVNVANEKLILRSRYAEYVPTSNLDCIVHDNIVIADVDFGHYHTLEINARLGYDGSLLPYLECIYDGDIVFSGKRNLGYNGQLGYNLTMGIYGWPDPNTGKDWHSPASDKPFVCFRNFEIDI